jgi:hypothetical protein
MARCRKEVVAAQTKEGLTLESVRRLSPKKIAGEILALVNKVNNSRLPWRKQTYHHSTLYRTKDGICTVFIVRRDDHEVLYPHNPFEVTVEIRLSDRDRDWVRLLITPDLAGTNLDPYQYRIEPNIFSQLHWLLQEVDLTNPPPVKEPRRRQEQGELDNSEYSLA